MSSWTLIWIQHLTRLDFKWDIFSFEELEKAAELLHGGNLVEISSLALAMGKKGSKDLTPEQIKAEVGTSEETESGPSEPPEMPMLRSTPHSADRS